MFFDYLRSGYAVKMKAVFGQASSYPKIYELSVIVTDAAFIPLGGARNDQINFAFTCFDRRND